MSCVRGVRKVGVPARLEVSADSASAHPAVAHCYAGVRGALAEHAVHGVVSAASLQHPLAARAGRELALGPNSCRAPVLMRPLQTSRCASVLSRWRHSPSPN